MEGILALTALLVLVNPDEGVVVDGVNVVLNDSTGVVVCVCSVVDVVDDEGDVSRGWCAVNCVVGASGVVFAVTFGCMRKCVPASSSIGG